MKVLKLTELFNTMKKKSYQKLKKKKLQYKGTHF